MTIRKCLHQLAVAVSMTEPEDQEGLRQVLGHLNELLAPESELDVPEKLAEVCREASERVVALLSGGEEDGEQGLEFVTHAVDFAQELLERVEKGESVDELVAPWNEEPEAPEASAEEPWIDAEMMEMFVSECGDSLRELESWLLDLENDERPEETISEVRRRIHTFKGECGILSLHDAQALCHEAESLIERTEASDSIPVDVLLDVVDWLGRHVVTLQESPGEKTPGHAALLERLRELTPPEEEEGAESDGEEAVAEAPTDEVPKVDEPIVPAAEPLERRESVDAPDAVDPERRVEFGEEALEDETLPEFIEESTGHLEDVEAALLEREDHPEDVEILNRIFRAFHTIKGVAGFLNIDPIVRLAHRTETLLDEFRSGTIECTQAHVDLIFESKDILGGMLAALAGSEAPLVREVDELVRRLDAAIAQEHFGAVALSSCVSTERVCSALHLDDAQAVEEVLERPERLWKRIGDILLERTALEREALEEALARQEMDAARGQHRKIGEVLVDLELVSQSDLDAALAEQASLAEVQPTPVAQLMDKEAPPQPERKGQRKLRTESFVKVGTQRLDSLVDMVGELVIAQQMVGQEPALQAIQSEALTAKLSHAAKITRDLQEGAMSLRMVTVKSTFQKMARLVRDVASKSGKEVRFEVHGEDTELDRNVVEQIGDPLVHLIRNAIDHGLESAEDRVAQGKSPKGTLRLGAYHQGGSIVIEVQDDGRGLDCDRILAKAIDRGLVPPGTTRDEVSDEEIQRMIFQAGFSTAAQVSDISGRGVGMDVVRRNIESMRGKVEIRSELGRGSTMTLRLPLTLAIIDGMVVRVGGRRYVIPTLSIEQSFQPAQDQVHGVLGAGAVVDVRGALLPVHRLKQAFDLGEGVDDVQEGILVLIEANGERACFLVDEILGQQQVVIKNLGKALPPMQGVSGGAILGDGRVALILDVDGLLSKAQCMVA